MQLSILCCHLANANKERLLPNYFDPCFTCARAVLYNLLHRLLGICHRLSTTCVTACCPTGPQHIEVSRA